jgi:hypothetical protein
LKKKLPDFLEVKRIKVGPLKSDASSGFNGAFMFNGFTVIVSDGGGWDHVSISRRERCPTFDELNWIKGLFFDAEETVVHFFPKKSQYVNLHPYCLHLWKKQGQDYELPPSDYVG